MHPSHQESRVARLNRFPWLPELPEDEEDKKDEPPEPPITILDLPELVWTQEICTFLDDDSRFAAREVNSSLYAGYYEIRTTFDSPNQVNALRALRLTEMGRVFPNVGHLHIFPHDLPKDETVDDIEEAVYPHYGQMNGFPRLASIECNLFDLGAFAGPDLGARPSITHLYLSAEIWEVRNEYFAEPHPESFPNLRFLEAKGCVEGLPPHPNIEVIDCGKAVSVHDLANLTREDFPNLKKVFVNAEDQRWHYAAFQDKKRILRHVARLKVEGIQVVFE